MEILIVGGGASGLVSAIKAAALGSDVTILEKNKQCGKKLLVTGNGHCNYWNDEQTLEKYHTEDKEELEIIYNFKKDEVLPFFKSLGIIPKVKNGYYYPFSNQSSSILNALLNMAEYYGVKIHYEEEVREIKKEKNFIVKTNKDTYQVEKVILATGSKAFVKDGCNGYELAKSLGHSIRSILPALVQLKSNDKICKNLKGVRCDVTVSLYEDDKLKVSENGEMQFCDYGISGICVLNLSSYVSKGLEDKKNEIVKVNFLPWLKEDVKVFLQKQSKLLPAYSLSDILEGFLNYKIVNELLGKAKITRTTKLEEIDSKTLEKIYEYLVSYPIVINGTNSYLEAQVCQGGIPLKEINPHTLESKLVKNLYITGELLDVDGVCGGYNLGFAWISGMIAGENASNKL